MPGLPGPSESFRPAPTPSEAGAWTAGAAAAAERLAGYEPNAPGVAAPWDFGDGIPTLGDTTESFSFILGDME
eukprot:11539688-Alexandrium_andersonii.AAC.1